MLSGFRRSVFILTVALPLLSSSQDSKPQNLPRNGGDFSDNVSPSATKVPTGVILVKGAWSSASDSVTPVPEGGRVTNNIFTDQYFGMTYGLPPNWEEKYKGPPPSDSGRYVLAQLRPLDTFKGARATLLVTAQDMFFNPLPGSSALDLINYSKDHLQADYKVEMPPTPTKIADRPFTFFAYWSPVAELHWYVMATEIRCHTVEIILSSRDTKLLEGLVLDLSKMKLTADPGPIGGSSSPVCVQDYAKDENLLARVEPVFTEHRFNAVPVRIIIDKDGKVKHIHFLSAFPDQAKAITDSLGQWKFKPYRQHGHPVEVETGLMFGRAVYPARRASAERAAQ
jgi:hypothetical protein